MVRFNSPASYNKTRLSVMNGFDRDLLTLSTGGTEGWSGQSVTQ